MKSFHNNCVRLLFHLALQRLASSCARYFCLYHEASIFLNVFSNTDKISFTSSLLSPTAVRFGCFSEYRTIVFFLSDLKWSSHCGYARLAPEHLDSPFPIQNKENLGKNDRDPSPWVVTWHLWESEKVKGWDIKRNVGPWACRRVEKKTSPIFPSFISTPLKVWK